MTYKTKGVNKMSKQINKVSRKDVMEAIDFLFVNGYVHEMTSDKKYGNNTNRKFIVIENNEDA